MALDYVLPLKWADGKGLAELADYLGEIVRYARVTVVDGSSPAARARHQAAFAEEVTVIAANPALALNGKVAGILTALPTLEQPKVIIADDDVRHTRDTLARICAALDDVDIVRPQNYFVTADGSPLPWHARWDTARSLINRAFGSDYPGTLGVRLEYLAGGYDGDLLFENLELIRTVRARGGRELTADELFVARRPPTTAAFFRQRVRQAYDSFAQPARLTAELVVLPTVLVLLLRRPVWLLYGLVGTVLVAETGRRRRGGHDVFPRTAAFWAPVWVLERGLCIWLALLERARGGVRYHNARLLTAANSLRTLTSRNETGA
nr:glycosyltransferase [Corynebacterium lemuris]